MPVTLERKRQRLVAAILREQKKALQKRIVRDGSGGGRVCHRRNPSKKAQRSRDCGDLTLSHRQNWPLPALIHAFLKTGLLITPETIDAAKPDDLKVWYAAVAGYFAAERRAKVGAESQAYH
jgi:hypothetical protein